MFIHYHIHKYRNLALMKWNYGILISVVIQAFVCLLFFVSPYTFIYLTFVFRIPNIATITVILLCIISSHFFVDCISTLYFVTPSRKVVKELFILWLLSKLYNQLFRNHQCCPPPTMLLKTHNNKKYFLIVKKSFLFHLKIF